MSLISTPNYCCLTNTAVMNSTIYCGDKKKKCCKKYKKKGKSNCKRCPKL